jgi:hypothetical protein
MLLYFILLSLLANLIKTDKKTSLSIIWVSQSPSSIIHPVSSSIHGGALIYIKVSGTSLD